MRDFTGGEADINDLPRFAKALENPVDEIFLPSVCCCSGLAENGVWLVVADRKVEAREKFGGVFPVE